MVRAFALRCQGDSLLEVSDMTLPNRRTVTLKLEAGLHLLRGPNGSGKSLLLKNLALLVPTTFERYFFQGLNVTTLPTTTLRRKVLYVPPSPLETLGSVKEYFTYPRQLKAYQGFTPSSEWQNIIEKLGLWEKDLARLSSGEKQLVQLARSLALAPSLALLDETVGHMDPERMQLAEEWIKRAVVQGTSVLMVGHDLSQAARLAAPVLRMEDL